jgi:hypothetical protein
LQKARQAKKTKKERQEQNVGVPLSRSATVALDEDLSVALEIGKEPKEFVEAQKIDVDPTDLGRRKRRREADEVVPQREEGWSAGWLVGAGVVVAGVGLAGAYAAHKNYATATSPAKRQQPITANSAPPPATELAPFAQAPWERV